MVDDIVDIVYIVHDWWGIQDDDVDSIFTDKDRAMQRAKEILKAGNSYGAWIDVMELNKPDVAERIYTEKNNDR